MRFRMEIRQNPKKPRKKSPTFNSLLVPQRMAQIEHRLFYSHIGFGSLGFACPVMAGERGRANSSVTFIGIGSPGRVVSLPATSRVVPELLGEGRAFSIQKEPLKGINQSCKGAAQHSPGERFGMGLVLSPSFRGQTEELRLIAGKRGFYPLVSKV